jgi:flagellar hook assembly protein FlgD
MFFKKISLLLLIFSQIFFTFSFRVNAASILETYTLNNQNTPTQTLNISQNQQVEIDIAFDKPTDTTLKILDLKGNTIKNIYQTNSVTNPTPKNWDGKDNNGQYVNTGEYTIELKYADNTDKTKKILVVNSGSILSSDASLDSLTINQGILSPKFNPKTLNYTVQLPAGSKLTPEINVETTTFKSTFTITNATDITSVDNVQKRTTKIDVKAEDGSIQTYAVIFNVNAIPTTQKTIKIIEFMPNPSGEDSLGEYIKLQNLSDSVINLKNWKIQDLDSGSTNSHSFNSDLTILANQTLTICRPASIANIKCDYQWSGMNLSNDYDIISLIDNQNLLVDQVSYDNTKVVNNLFVKVDQNGNLLLQDLPENNKPVNLTTYTLNNQNTPTQTLNISQNQQVEIDIAFDKPTDTTLKILDLNGNTIKNIYQTNSVTNPTPKNWDGKDNNGQYVNTGEYTIELKYADNTDKTKKILVVNSGSSSSSTNFSSISSSSENSSQQQSSSSSFDQVSSSINSSAQISSQSSQTDFDLKLDLSIEQNQLSMAQTATFNLEIFNLSEIQTNNLILDFYLPKELTFLNSFYLNGEEINPKESQFFVDQNQKSVEFKKLTMNLKDLNPGQKQNLTIKALVLVDKNQEMYSFANLSSNLMENMVNNSDKVDYKLLSSSNSNSADSGSKNTPLQINSANSNPQQLKNLIRTGGYSLQNYSIYFLLFSTILLFTTFRFLLKE